MAAVDTLRQRNAFTIEDQYISQILSETGEDIFTDQARMAAQDAEDLSDILGNRSYVVSNRELKITHIIRQRFVDMRFQPKWARKKAIPLHNKLIYANFNRLARKAAFGFTNAAKNIIAQQYNIEV